MFFSQQRLMTILLSLPGVIIAITFHEIAHGYAAEAMGDDTAERAGRLSLNPLHHLDPIGLLSMALFGFGWAKPVLVNPNNFRDRKKGIILVSLAGCLTNLLIGLITLLVLYAVRPFANDYLYTILYYIYLYDVVFGIFNLIPIPPLDGSQILYEFLPYKGRQFFNRYARYGTLVLLVLVFTGIIGMIMNPIVGAVNTLFNAIARFIFGLF